MPTSRRRLSPLALVLFAAALFFGANEAHAQRRVIIYYGRPVEKAGLFMMNFRGGPAFGVTNYDSSLRFLGALGKVDARLDYYGLLGKARAYQLDGVGLMQQLQARAGETDWFFGPRYAWLKVNPAFGDGWPADLDGRPLREVRIGRLSLVGSHDTRDNIFTPTDGHFVEAELVAASPQLGGTSSYQQVNLRGFDWIPMGKPFILALRGDVQTSRGDIPFFAKPFVNLRGIPAVRYQDNNAAVAEVELWWQATPRWSLLGFTGAGRAWGKRDTFSQTETVSTVGAGFRYLIARKLGLHAGIDFATGPEGRAFYIQVGSPWR